jgi:hypothetical protein
MELAIMQLAAPSDKKGYTHFDFYFSKLVLAQNQSKEEYSHEIY